MFPFDDVIMIMLPNGYGILSLITAIIYVIKLYMYNALVTNAYRYRRI